MASIREIKLTNTLSGKKETLKPLVPGKIKMYSCGPTVWNFIHIGNLRSGVVSDMFFKYFKRVGYDVKYVRNYTDVDDKIIAQADKEKTTASDLAKKYIHEVEKDFLMAGMAEPTVKTTVTQYMSKIISMIETIISKGHAYEVEGEVLYSVESFEGYGKLSKRKLEDNEAGLRVEVDPKKKNPFDFTLWKPAKKGEPFWKSPWGEGRPGWHIECSAMSCDQLGDQMDIHHGGEDLIFPHHENEIAQSEAASGHVPFSTIWLHHAFLNLSNQKMSKSLGNIMLAREFLDQYGGEFARYMLLSTHYRSIINFADETVEQTLQGLERIYLAKEKALQMSQFKSAMPDMMSEIAWGEFVADIQKTKKLIDEAYANDFNIPEVLASLFTLIREFNRILATPKAATTPAGGLAGLELLKIFDEDIFGILGFGGADPKRILSHLTQIKAKRLQSQGVQTLTEAEILQAIEDRKQARLNRDFAKADQIRKDLESKGVLLKDSPGGTTWEFI